METPNLTCARKNAAKKTGACTGSLRVC